ncbi:MAG TPA: hypothetical protein DCQ50_09100 [Chryseobacterium sp.]|nr:hypothetical protein [Chryseobacterium sp.]
MRKKLSGFIYFENYRVCLRIYGGPIPGTDYMKYDLNFHEPFPILYGECLEFNQVSLINLKLANFKSSDGRAQYDYTADFLIKGSTHFSDLYKPLITYSMLSFYRMNEFLNEKVIVWEDFFRNEVNAKIQIQNKEARMLFQNRYREDYIHHRLSVTQVFNPANDFIRSSFFCNSNFKKKINFFDYVDNWIRFQTFFSIATCKNKNIETAYFRCGKLDFEVVNSDILFNREKGDESSRNLVIMFSEIEKKENKPFEKWMFHYNSIEHSVLLYQNALKDFQTLTTKNYFLNMFFCNESIMKETIGYLKPIEKIPVNVVSIIEKYGIKGNDRERLLSKFKKNHPTCLNYFENLQLKLPSVVDRIFGEDYLDEMRKAKNTRDSFVHKNIETVKEVIANEEELRRTASKLRVLFQANCLLFMGFEDQEIRKMLFRNPSNDLHKN